MRVWHVETGALMQTVHGEIKLISQEPRILVKMEDGRVIALQLSSSG
jgi:hypothetical protein